MVAITNASDNTSAVTTFLTIFHFQKTWQLLDLCLIVNKHGAFTFKYFPLCFSTTQKMNISSPSPDPL